MDWLFKCVKTVTEALMKITVMVSETVMRLNRMEFCS